MKKYYKRWLKVLGVLERVHELSGYNLYNKETLKDAFTWSETEEGNAFWAEIDDRLDSMLKLAQRVYDIDPAAAQYIQKDMWKSKEREKVNATFPYDGDNVYTMFKWEKTAQGHDYWSRIASKLDNANV